MSTAFDWLSVGLFSALALLFLIRSARPVPGDRMIAYLPPALGCAAGNQLGNHGYPIAALAVLAASIVFVLLVLGTLKSGPDDGSD